MKIRVNVSLATLASLFILEATPVSAQVTAFSYQGRLSDTNGQPLNGNYDFQFRLFDAPTGGGQVPVVPVSPDVTVSNGLFTTGLDFGNNVFDGTTYWLEIAVQPHTGGGFATLSPRQLILPAPYAITAGNVLGGGLAGTYSNALTLNNPANTFAGNGNGLTSVNAASLGGIASSNFWQVGGNSGSPNGTFGMLDGNLPLNIFAGGEPLLRLETVQRSLGFLQPSFIAGNLTGGSEVNLIWGGVLGGTIGGGGGIELFPIIGQTLNPNVVSDDFGTVGGGLNNLAGNTNGDLTDVSYATIGGGYLNVAGGSASTVGGGMGNTATGQAATVGGGQANASSAQDGTIGGGIGNIADGQATTVGGGYSNVVNSQFGTVAGGTQNSAFGLGATIGGGYQNIVTFGGVIAGGQNNNASGDVATIAGGAQNIASGDESFIGGGGLNTNSDLADTIGGGQLNYTSGIYSTVNGGLSNLATNNYATVAGGNGNISGGYASTVPGGNQNYARGDYSFAAGNQAYAINPGCFVWADSENSRFASTANDQFLIRAEGGVGINNNSPAASLDVSGTVHFEGVNGWDVNNGEGDFRVGGNTYRFKMGVATNGSGAGDVWMRAQGGTGRVFLKTPGGTTIFSNEGQTSGVSLAAGSGAWSNLSDRNTKENFAAVDAQEILQRVAALSLSTWNYKSQEKAIRHIGPMAQDFASAFQVGEDDRHITTIDSEGVALAAIKGLNEKVESENTALRAENAELKARLDKIEQLLSSRASTIP